MLARVDRVDGGVRGVGRQVEAGADADLEYVALRPGDDPLPGTAEPGSISDTHGGVIDPGREGVSELDAWSQTALGQESVAGEVGELHHDARSLELSTVASVQASRWDDGARAFDRERLTVCVGVGLARREAERVLDSETDGPTPPLVDTRAGPTPVDRSDPEHRRLTRSRRDAAWDQVGRHEVREATREGRQPPPNLG